MNDEDARLPGGGRTLAITELPEGAKGVIVVRFEGRDDHYFQRDNFEYADGMTIPAGILMFLIEDKGYEPFYGGAHSRFWNYVA